MKIVANIVLIALIVFLGYLLVNSIKEPIAFETAKKARKEAVAEKLEEVREAQKLYRDITGSFAGDWQQLVDTLRMGQIPFIKKLDDPNSDDPEMFITEITYSPAIDSVKAMGISLDSLKYIPYTNGGIFSIQSDTVEYQSTKVNVVEVSTTWKAFMGEYGDPRFAKYDKTYDPNKPFKFGDMNSPSLSGNWE